MAEPVKSTHPTASVELEDDHVVIRDLSMDGALADLVRVGIEHGRDPEAIVREAIEVGAAVLVHGAAKSTVDAVGAEVDRLLTALNERSLRIESLGRMAGKVAAKGLVYEAELGVALETCFAPHQDMLEATGATTGTADDKVGDFVATLNPKQTGGRRLRVVIEAKDRPLSMLKTSVSTASRSRKAGPPRSERARPPLRRGEVGHRRHLRLWQPSLRVSARRSTPRSCSWALPIAWRRHLSSSSSVGAHVSMLPPRSASLN
jgi:hypothetical protein